MRRIFQGKHIMTSTRTQGCRGCVMDMQGGCSGDWNKVNIRQPMGSSNAICTTQQCVWVYAKLVNNNTRVI